MKKLIGVLCALTMLLSIAMVGCRANSTTSSESTTEQKEFTATEMTIYIRMMESQDKWFRENIIAKFEKEYGVKINVRTFENVVDLENILEMDKDKNTIGLVKTEANMVAPLAKKGLMMDIESVAGDNFDKDMAEYLDIALDLGKVDGTLYYIPRKLETNTLLYLKSKVADAVANWKPLEADINAMFKAENGFGLPTGYNLEADPNEWDWYDLAVVGYYWSNTEIDGTKEARIAHRGKKYNGTQTELVTKMYQAGATEEDILAMNTAPIVEAFKWEELFVDNGLYNSGMWEEEWSGGGIWKAMAAGKVYLAFMHQIDAFSIHGGTDPSMTGYLVDPDDMGLAIMPKGVSLELKDGEPVTEGVHGSQIGGWWWGIPTSTPDAALSYELARFITNEENHTAECSTFGMMPVRKDIMENIDGTFSEQWIRDVFDVAQAQLAADVKPMPTNANWPEIGNLYLEAWYDIAVDKSTSDVQGILDDYAKQAADILK